MEVKFSTKNENVTCVPTQYDDAPVSYNKDNPVELFLQPKGTTWSPRNITDIT